VSRIIIVEIVEENKYLSSDGVVESDVSQDGLYTRMKTILEQTALINC